VTHQQLFALAAAGIILLVGFPIHEFSHAFAADRLGDRTARYLGRLSLDPRRHFDPLGGLILIISTIGFGIPVGWAKPTPVNPRNLAYGHRGEAIVALAGPASNLVMAAVAALSVRIIDASPSLQDAIAGSDALGAIYGVLAFFIFINVVLFVFNLLPIPPLDGWAVLKGLVSARTAFQLRQVEQYGVLLLFGIFFFGARIILPIADAIFALLAGRPFFL
jgi:Zn-dependent protease